MEVFKNDVVIEIISSPEDVGSIFLLPCYDCCHQFASRFICFCFRTVCLQHMQTKRKIITKIIQFNWEINLYDCFVTLTLTPFIGGSPFISSVPQIIKSYCQNSKNCTHIAHAKLVIQHS